MRSLHHAAQARRGAESNPATRQARRPDNAGMNGVLIIAHAPLAHALRQCALHVFPDAAGHVAALDVRPDATPEQTLAAARAALEHMPVEGVLVLTDLVGATPCNVAQRLIAGRPCRLVAGVNLSMVLRALTYRHEPLDALAQRALTGGSQGVVDVNAALSSGPRPGPA